MSKKQGSSAADNCGSLQETDPTLLKPGTSKGEGNDAFQVDTALIPQASLSIDEQNSELNNLGLSIFNQDVFEEGNLL